MFDADSVEIRILVDNWIDMLLPECEAGERSGIATHTRNGLVEHFDPKSTPPQAENGISFLVRARRGERSTTVVFDAGLTGNVLLHNIHALPEDVSSVDQVLISHGHPDHYGGIYELLSLIGHPVPLVTHPDAFLPRYAVMPDGRTSPFYNASFSQEKLIDSGARPVLTKEPIELGWGLRTTGEIPREVSFEGPRPPAAAGAPGLYQTSPTGEFRLDEVWDEQALIIDVKGEGLIVLTGCAHAGAVNTLRRAKQISGDKPIRAIMGGFHLGFATTPKENVDKTVDAFKDLDVGMVVPMHCSGLRAHVAFAGAMASRYLQPSVGTLLRFGA